MPVQLCLYVALIHIIDLAAQGVEHNSEAGLQAVSQGRSRAGYADMTAAETIAAQRCLRNSACSKPLGHAGFCDSGKSSSFLRHNSLAGLAAAAEQAFQALPGTPTASTQIRSLLVVGLSEFPFKNMYIKLQLCNQLREYNMPHFRFVQEGTCKHYVCLCLQTVAQIDTLHTLSFLDVVCQLSSAVLSSAVLSGWFTFTCVLGIRPKADQADHGFELSKDWFS